MDNLLPQSVIRKDRLLNCFRDISRFGATPNGGVNRMTGTRADAEARDQLCSMMQKAGLAVKIDEIGNIFGLAEWNPGADFILLGSHLDSQPNGGRFDGAYGVIAALEAVSSIHEEVSSGRLPLPALNMAVVNWTNEEGARFRPSLTGSSVYAGQLNLREALGLKDDDGVTLNEALGAIGYRGHDTPPNSAAAIEIHVEQGRRLEDAGIDLAAVTGNWGANKYEVRLTGRQAHTGPTPMAERHDALLAASYLVVSAREWADIHDDKVFRTSVGRAVIEPNSANVVPSIVTVSLELRSPNADILEHMNELVHERLKEISQMTGCTVDIVKESHRKPLLFWDTGVKLTESIATQLGFSCMRLDTVAGHDVVALMNKIPGLLVFVPSYKGIGHHEQEFTDERHLINGCEMLSQLAWSLSTNPPEQIHRCDTN